MQTFTVQAKEDVVFVFDGVLQKWVIKNAGTKIGSDFSDQYVTVQVTRNTMPSPTPTWGTIQLNTISDANFDPDDYVTHFSTSHGVTQGVLNEMTLGEEGFKDEIGEVATKAAFGIGTDDIRIFLTSSGSGIFNIEDHHMVLRVQNGKLNIWHHQK